MHRRSLIVAWCALMWERAVPVVWPGLAWAVSFAVLALLGVWEVIGDPWRAIYALASLAGAIWLTRKGLARFAWPQVEDLARRVEEDSGITARPHEALLDTPPTDDPVALQVWHEHQARMARRLESAKARRPRAAWARQDRWALRGSLALALCVSWFLAGPAAQDRLGEAFSLAPIQVGGLDVSVDAWIDPPAYTGRAPIFLTAETRTVEVPAGSTFVSRIAGSRRAPTLTRRDSGGSERATASSIGDSVWDARLTVPVDANIRLAAGPTRQSWTLTVIPDRAPIVRLLAVPDSNSSGELDLQFSVVDDYGATAYALELRPETDPDAEWERIEITPAGITTLDTENGVRTLLETARHPLAGSRVTIRVAAGDAGGNTGRSPELGITLPHRIFLNALARAVAEQRRNVLNADQAYAPLTARPVLYAEDVAPGMAYLADEPERRIERAPEGLQFAARALDAITDAPARFFDDAVVYLGLRASVQRLRRSREQADLAGLQEDLWHIALRAELGSLADAEAALRAAERALMEALARGADETELAGLFDAFQEAMDNYMAAMAAEAARSGETPDPNAQELDTSSLQGMLDALREAAELGDTADARQALQQLSELLRNMQMQMGQGSGEGEQDDPINEAIQDALEELGDVIGSQRDLQDQTFGLGQEQESSGSSTPQSGGQTGQQDGNMPQSLAENQNGGGASAQSLGTMQGELAEQLGQAQQALPNGGSESLAQAGEAMRAAADALGEGDAAAALEAQEEALAGLRAGAEQLAQELLERMQDAQGEAGQGQEERDPLGRPSEGAFADGSGVEIPDEMARARARSILEELRRRAAEAGRPQDELDYIERLLDRF
ncbi:DUF4175 domain-containing protein [Maricaulis sp.]|uniref:DUF4175 domain-containing protein n=1 Tax=Maricaulis sp. TaxID=1486257 RepID=UPI003A8D16AC